ncbi:MAG: hypothetical protein HYV36_03650 [Lentisphaerae bacterium]|nr:hypothetical protein [Lentisphaerota bacterium]
MPARSGCATGAAGGEVVPPLVGSGCATGAAGGEVVPPLVATPRAWQARFPPEADPHKAESRAARDGEPLVKSSGPDQNESGWRACPPVEGLPACGGSLADARAGGLHPDRLDSIFSQFLTPYSPARPRGITDESLRIGQ